MRYLISLIVLPLIVLGCGRDLNDPRSMWLGHWEKSDGWKRNLYISKSKIYIVDDDNEINEYAYSIVDSKSERPGFAYLEIKSEISPHLKIKIGNDGHDMQWIESGTIHDWFYRRNNFTYLDAKTEP